MARFLQVWITLMFACSFSIAAEKIETTECAFCFEQMQLNTQENICTACLYEYVKVKIESGHASIVMPSKYKNDDLYNFGHQEGIEKSTKDYKRLEKYYFTNESITQIISENDSLLQTYDKNIARVLNLQQGIKPCSNFKCQGSLIKPIVNESVCDSCGTVYKRDNLGNDVRHCPHCDAPIERIQGCDTVFCTICRQTFSWSKAKEQTCCCMIF